MDEFLGIIYTNYASETGLLDDYLEYFKNFDNKLKGTVAEEPYKGFVELFTDCVAENNRHYFIEGMKLAIAIMNKKYVPTV